jgi:hypothetical protein
MTAEAQSVITGQDFSGQPLRNKVFKGLKFQDCNFDRADLSYADCSYASFISCSFKDSICYRTNFKDSILANSVFEPADCYGMTITLNCKTFENVQLSQQWWFSMLIFLASMIPASGPVKEDLRAKLIEMIGAVRYTKLRAIFERRDA